MNPTFETAAVHLSLSIFYDLVIDDLNVEGRREV
jgi:hypothetical protein